MSLCEDTPVPSLVSLQNPLPLLRTCQHVFDRHNVVLNSLCYRFKCLDILSKWYSQVFTLLKLPCCCHLYLSVCLCALLIWSW